MANPWLALLGCVGLALEVARASSAETAACFEPVAVAEEP
jgi:hypothetical protein